MLILAQTGMLIFYLESNPRKAYTTPTLYKPTQNITLNFLLSPQHERKYSSDGEASPVVVKLEHLESLVDPSSVFSIENSNPYANYFPHFTPSQLNQVNI